MARLGLWLAKARGAAGTAFAWINQNAARVLVIMIIALCVALLFQHRRNVALTEQVTQLDRAARGWRKASHAWRGSYVRVKDALDQQNLAVAALGDESDARQAKGAAALRDARPVIDAMERGAARIRAAAPPADACRTPEAVMAARELL